jgi:hypothetical protein
VKLKTGTRWLIAFVLTFSFTAFANPRKDDKKDKAKPHAQVIDSGSFGVFVKGQRMLTETFTIEHQDAATSVIKAQLKEPSTSATIQKSELQVTTSGELVRYDWSQESGGSITVYPNNDFLMEKITPAGTGKTAEQSFLMPSTSSILDNNFFVQREVLLWRYLAADCKTEGGEFKCQQGPVEFGTVVPQDRTSVSVRVQMVGKEKVNIHGADRELLRLNLTGESFEWAIWVDDHDQFKLMRVSIPADNTEVVRD